MMQRTNIVREVPSLQRATSIRCRATLVYFLCLISTSGAQLSSGPTPIAVPPADVPDLVHLLSSGSITANSKRLNYELEVHEFILRSSSGVPRATEVTFSYLLKVPNGKVEQRPVIFIFNGGPGSASIWQHLGFYGPRRVKLTDEVHPPITPPFELEDNPHTILDIADLVFIDPVGTGYARLIKPEFAPDYFGIDQDAVAMAEVIEAWLTRHQRWNSPKFLGGESYGTIRSAMLAHNLMGGPLSKMGRMMGITLNGIIVLGPTLMQDQNLPRGLVTLPSAAATAWYFKLAGQADTLPDFMEKVEKWSAEVYAAALAEPTNDEEKRLKIANKFAAFTGLSTELVVNEELQPSLESVRGVLLKDRGLRLGAYDSRYTLPINDSIGPPDPVTDDPSMCQYTPAFIGAFQLYMAEVGLKTARPYKAIEWESVNSQWDYSPLGRGPKTPLQALHAAMNRNARLGLFIGVGWYDLVTTAAGADDIARRLGMVDRVVLKKYPSGHMPYLGEESATQLECDIRAFIENQTR